MQKIVLASQNKGKIDEFNHLLTPLKFTVLPLADFTDESAVEAGATFIENAIIKARFAAEKSGLPALADDSGLVVNALEGAPGIYSARYAGLAATDEENLQLLLKNMENLTGHARQAYYYCALVFLQYPTDPAPLISTAKWAGIIADKPVGKNGFGYDPIFYLPEHHCTAAELTLTDKQAMSHRGKSTQQLLKQFTA